VNNSFGIKFEGFDETIRELYRLQGSALKPIIEECLDAVSPMITPNITQDMTPHNRTYRTQDSIVQDAKVVWDSDTEAHVSVGFNIKKGGLPSIFLMYGTPRHAPNHGGQKADERLYNDIMGDATDEKIARKQKQIYDREVKRLFG